MALTPKQVGFRRMHTLMSQEVLPGMAMDDAEYFEARANGFRMFGENTIRGQIRDYIVEYVREKKGDGIQISVRQARPSDNTRCRFVGIQAKDIATTVYGDRKDFREKGMAHWETLVRSHISGMQQRGFPIGTTDDVLGYMVPMTKEDIHAIEAAYTRAPKGRPRREIMREVFQEMLRAAIPAEELESSDLRGQQVIENFEQHMALYHEEGKENRRKLRSVLRGRRGA